MILYILLILILFLCNDKNTKIEYYTNKISTSDFVNISEKEEESKEESNINVCDNRDKHSLIYTSNENNDKIKKYLESSQERLNKIVKKYIDDSKVKLSMIPIEQYYLEPEPKDDFILPFDKSINQVSIRNRKYIDNMCTGYWGKWIGKEDCKVDTPCKKIHRRWNYNNLGDEDDHNCKTDSTGFSNINKEIDFKDYKRQIFNIDDPSKYPSNVDVARCDQVINYSQEFNINDEDYTCDENNNNKDLSNYEYIFTIKESIDIFDNLNGKKYKRFEKELKKKIAKEFKLNNKQKKTIKIKNIRKSNNNTFIDVYIEN